MKIKFTIPKNLIKEHGKSRCYMMKEYLERKMKSEFQQHMIYWEQESKKRNMIESKSIGIQQIDCITYIGNYYDSGYADKKITKNSDPEFVGIEWEIERKDSPRGFKELKEEGITITIKMLSSGDTTSMSKQCILEYVMENWNIIKQDGKTKDLSKIKAIAKEKHDELYCPKNPKKHWNPINRAKRAAYADVLIGIERIERE